MKEKKCFSSPGGRVRKKEERRETRDFCKRVFLFTAAKAKFSLVFPKKKDVRGSKKKSGTREKRKRKEMHSLVPCGLFRSCWEEGGCRKEEEGKRRRRRRSSFPFREKKERNSFSSFSPSLFQS